MSYEEFLEQVKLLVKERMEGEVRISIYPVTKNNSIVLDGLTILEQGDNISPAIYLNGYYREYQSGEKMDRIIARILASYYRGKKLQKLDTSFYTDVRRVENRVVCRLINQEKNEKLLKQIPHQKVLNLAVVYYYLMDNKDIGEASILIRNEHLKNWRISKERLHETALENTRRLLPCEFISMEELMHSLLGANAETLLESEADPEVPLYVLTNKAKNYGAVWMVDHYILEAVGNRIRKDYYILPSSVHECMVVPTDGRKEASVLLEMVREMNRTQVEPEEVLADTIYLYDREQRQLQLIAE